MLYLFHGPDIATAGEKARALVASLRAKRPDAAYDKVDAETWNPAIIEGHLGGQGLFSSKYIIFVDRVTENEEAKDGGLEHFIPAMQESPNIFVVLEGKLPVALVRAFEKSAEKMVECAPKESAAGAKKSEFNVFALADAVGKRDIFKAWSLYRQAIDTGSEPEAIVGMLFWKAKTVADKGLARELITIYHEAHRGRRDLELAAEQCILKLARP